MNWLDLVYFAFVPTILLQLQLDTPLLPAQCSLFILELRMQRFHVLIADE